MLTCKVGNTIINCFNGKYDKFTLKKWSEENRLLCPDCGNFYEYCHGEIIHPYFRHKEKNKDCEGIYYEPETEEHIRGKIMLYNWLLKQNGLSNIKLEAYIPETRQRPDLYFEVNDKRFVIEFQCSPIATEYLERHELYKLAGINDIWILGTDKYIEKAEIGNRFRDKVIEQFVRFYFDPMCKLFMFNNFHLNTLGLSDFRFKTANGKYYDDDKRHLLHNKLISFDNDIKKYIIDINGLIFKDDSFLLSEEAFDKIKQYSDKKKEKALKRQETIRKNEESYFKKFQEYEEEAKLELNKLKQELAQFNDKPIYLLFLEDNRKLDNIRFKMVNNYPDNILSLAGLILKELKFIESKGAKEYVLMMPRKRIKESSSMMYPYYKVLNHKHNVLNDFKELGINFLKYEDLRGKFNIAR